MYAAAPQEKHNMEPKRVIKRTLRFFTLPTHRFLDQYSFVLKSNALKNLLKRLLGAMRLSVDVKVRDGSYQFH